MDRVSKKKRSKIMRSIKSENTKPEKAVRSSLYKRGYRYRIHLSELPGTPDIVLRKYGVIIFINGCFWHQHGCDKTSMPKTNRKFWKEKLENNKRRDAQNKKQLEEMGWKVVVVWECDINSDLERTVDSIERTLNKRSEEKIRIKKNGKRKPATKSSGRTGGRGRKKGKGKGTGRN